MSAAGKTSLRNTVWVSAADLTTAIAKIYYEHILMIALDLIRSKGLEKINLDDLVEELLPKGRALVPTKIKEDLLARIKTYLENDSDYKRLTGY